MWPSYRTVPGCCSHLCVNHFLSSIRAMADLARTAIENEQKLQQQLILEDKEFVVDWVSRFMICYYLNC